VPAEVFSQNLHYADCNEAFAPYKVGAHRHTPEIEQALSKAAGKDIKITFVPHLLPIKPRNYFNHLCRFENGF
jgi:N-acetyl-gamma-glutamylphosphate reductase